MAKRSAAGTGRTAAPIKKRAAAKAKAKRKPIAVAPATKPARRTNPQPTHVAPTYDNQLAQILSAIEQLRADIAVGLSRPQPTPTRPAAPAADIVAHVQNSGDVHADLGTWIGTRRSGRWIEGFCIAVQPGISPEDFLYQAVLGNNWHSPWVPSGKLCGSQGLALPLRGFCISLRGTAASKYDCSYSASFVDGTNIDALTGGQVCATATFAPLEAFQITLRPRTR